MQTSTLAQLLRVGTISSQLLPRLAPAAGPLTIERAGQLHNVTLPFLHDDSVGATSVPRVATQPGASEIDGVQLGDGAPR